MDIILYLAALFLLAGLLAYIALILVSSMNQASALRANARLERQFLTLRIEQVLDERRFEKEKHDLSWNGFRKFEIVRKVRESDDICSFYLTPHDRKSLPRFKPGQYLTFQLSMADSAGVKKAGSKPVIRCYSLSDSPNHPDYYRVTIKKIAAPPDKPEAKPGLASSYFHEVLKEGDILDVKAPSGQFWLDLNKQSGIVLIGGGVGVTPVLSMLNALVEAGSRREIWFFFGLRNQSEHIMKDHLKKIVAGFPNIHLQVCYSQPAKEDAKDRDYHQAERVSVKLFKRLLPSNNFEFYICGPGPMMDQMVQDLKDWGVPETSIFFEAFGPATVKKISPPEQQAPAGTAGTAILEVTFSKSGKSFGWKPDAGSLLDFAEANGITMDSGCRAGNCGTCLTAVKSGEISYLVNHGAKPEAGSCLACICIPKTSLVLDA